MVKITEDAIADQMTPVMRSLYEVARDCHIVGAMNDAQFAQITMHCIRGSRELEDNERFIQADQSKV